MDFKKIELPETKIIGSKIHTSYEDGVLQVPGDIMTHWMDFFGNGVLNEIPNIKDTNAIWGVYTDYTSDHTGEYSLTLGAEVTTDEELPEDMSAVTIPSGSYLVFEAEEKSPEAILDTWKGIWDYFTSDERKHEWIYDVSFEKYDNDNDSVEIYIHVK